MKKIKINKMALSVATAFLMLTSIVSTVASASGGNEIKLTSDKNFAQAGDSINVKASLEPDKTGVAGFTIDLHYDPSKVTVYVPTDEESESTYNVGSKFSVITNYVASSGTIKIVGANLTGSNIKDRTDLALATFKVKDGVTGKINYWVEVETMVAEADGGYKSVSYSAPTEGSPLTVSAGEEITTTPATTTTTASSKAEATTTTSKSTTTTTTTGKTTTKSEATTTTTAKSEKLQQLRQSLLKPPQRLQQQRAKLRPPQPQHLHSLSPNRFSHTSRVTLTSTAKLPFSSVSSFLTT